MSNYCAVCSIPCKTTCGHCKKVSYCSVDHQRTHRREHKEECFPAIQKESEEFGPYFVATRNIKPLEVIWVEQPIMMVPDCSLPIEETPPMCFGCCVILPGTLQSGFPKCPSCGWPLCSPSCKDLHWHSQFECQVFQKNKLGPLDFKEVGTVYESINILRMVILKRQNSKKWKQIISLKTSIDADIFRRKSGGVPSTVVVGSFIDFICNRCKLHEDSSVFEKLLFIYIRYSVHRRTNQSIQLGNTFSSILYAKRAKLLHNCQANTFTAIAPGRSKEATYAAVDIKAGDILYGLYTFDIITMDIPGQFERRSKLLEDYQFWCKCDVCLDPSEKGTFYSAIKCNKKQSGRTCPGYFLPSIVTDKVTIDQLVNEKWKCNFPTCRATEKYSNLKKIIDPIQKQIDLLGDYSDVEKLFLINQLENVTLHENHFLITHMRFSILPHLLYNLGRICQERNGNPSLRFATAEILKSNAQKCLGIAEKFHPGSTFRRGVILFFIVAENQLRVKYNIPNAQPTMEMEKLRTEALSILKLMTEGSYCKELYRQLQTEIELDKVFLQALAYGRVLFA